MCGNCGCSITENITIQADFQGHESPHHHDHSHDHSHNHLTEHHHSNGEHTNHTHAIEIKQSIFAKNDRLAERNRGYFLAKNLFVLNIVSSPGSGKTALLERMIETLNSRQNVLQQSLNTAVIVGDLETDNDAQRLRRNNIPVAQITTGTVCHLDAEMVLNAARKLPLDGINVLIIENVGNLVCPAAYDLGEHLRIVILSTTEGEDKPLKYPTMFKSADVVIINKIDIAEVVGFRRDIALENIQKMAPQAKIFELSARTGEGISPWLDYLHGQYQDNIGNFALMS